MAGLYILNGIHTFRVAAESEMVSYKGSTRINPLQPMQRSKSRKTSLQYTMCTTVQVVASEPLWLTCTGTLYVRLRY